MDGHDKPDGKRPAQLDSTVEMRMLAADGETDDLTFVWLPEEQVLCCGQLHTSVVAPVFSSTFLPTTEQAAPLWQVPVHVFFWVSKAQGVTGCPVQPQTPYVTLPVASFSDASRPQVYPCVQVPEQAFFW